MKEKVVPIPFLGREVSGWLYRTSRWMREHPFKSFGIFVCCAGGSILYEARVVHKDRMPSPNVNNHLEYQLKAQRQVASSMANTNTTTTTTTTTNDATSHERAIADAERLLANTTDVEQRKELEAIIARERQLLSGVHDTTLFVRSGQLAVRNPHWEIRNNERNWSILARDQQQQKDHYWYRKSRSQEDDYARNTYSRP